jgi:hypothetical protein
LIHFTLKRNTRRREPGGRVVGLPPKTQNWDFVSDGFLALIATGLLLLLSSLLVVAFS